MGLEDFCVPGSLVWWMKMIEVPLSFMERFGISGQDNT